MADSFREVTEEEVEALVGWLGDSPQTVQSIHRLRRGMAGGHVAGPIAGPAAVLVESLYDPGEHAGFGEDPELLWGLLRSVPGWTAVHVAPSLAGPLAAAITRETGRPPVLVEELYYLPDGPIEAAPDPVVRRLTEADIPTMEAATEALDMQGWRLGTAAALVRESVTAGAVVDGELVAVAFAGYRSDRHAEVGIKTRADHRNRGLSTAAAALVCAAVAAGGRTPVWSTGEDNVASRRVAAKLGFREVSRRVYVNRG